MFVFISTKENVSVKRLRLGSIRAGLIKSSLTWACVRFYQEQISGK